MVKIFYLLHINSMRITIRPIENYFNLYNIGWFYLNYISYINNGQAFGLVIDVWSCVHSLPHPQHHFTLQYLLFNY